MAEYIEREAVLKIIGDNCPHDKCGYNTEEEMGAGAACYYIGKDVEKIPTADVAEVVRFKDCVWWETRTFGSTIGRCENPHNGLVNEYSEENDFCSCGERKE